METYKDKSLGVLNAGIAAGATSLVLQSGQGANFPAPATEGSFYVWIWRSDYATPALDPTAEKVLCSARTTDTFTIGATANAHNTAGKTYYVMAALNPTTQTKLSAFADLVEVTNNAAVLNKAIHAGGDNGGYLLDGSDDYISIANNNNLIFGTNDFSIEAWFKLNSVTSSASRSIVQKRLSGGIGFNLFVSSNGKLNFLYDDDNLNNATTITSTGLLEANKWTHVLCVVSGTTVYLYVNGVLFYTGSLNTRSALNNTDNLFIGCVSGSLTFFAGVIGLVRLFNRALTAGEAVVYHNNNRPDLSILPYTDRGASQTDFAINGTFDADTNWVKEGGWTISGGVANGNNTSNFLYQAKGSPSPYINKKVKITYTVVVVSGTARCFSGSNYGVARSISGTYTEELIWGATVNENLFGIRGASFTGTIDNVIINQIGCVAEYLPQNAGKFGWIDSSGNQLSGATSGSPICLTTQSRPALHREIKMSIANTATTLSGVVPRGYRIAAVRLKATAAIIAVKIGTSSGGEQIVASTSASTTATLATLAATVNAGYSETADTTLYVEHATAGQTLDVIFELMKVGN